MHPAIRRAAYAAIPVDVRSVEVKAKERQQSRMIELSRIIEQAQRCGVSNTVIGEFLVSKART